MNATYQHVQLGSVQADPNLSTQETFVNQYCMFMISVTIHHTAKAAKSVHKVTRKLIVR